MSSKRTSIFWSPGKSGSGDSSDRPLVRFHVLKSGQLENGSRQSARGLGIGKSLLRFGFELAERMREEFGCVGVLVDARPDAVDFYRTYGFEAIDVLEGASAQVPRAAPMNLALGSVPRAGG